MKIVEVRKMKDEMDESIGRQLETFARVTGLAVTDIDLKLKHTHWLDNGKQKIHISYHIETRVEI